MSLYDEVVFEECVDPPEMGQLISAPAVSLEVVDEYLHVLYHFECPLEDVVEGRLLVVLVLAELQPVRPSLLRQLHFPLRDYIDYAHLFLVVQLL